MRCGVLYGSGTAIAPDGPIPQLLRKRQLPVVGAGAGVWSFVHIDGVAQATAPAVEGGPGGIDNIVDNEPTEAAEWCPEPARALGAKPPLHVPQWLARLLMGEAGVSMVTRIRGACNAKAKRVLRWGLRYRPGEKDSEPSLLHSLRCSLRRVDLGRDARGMSGAEGLSPTGTGLFSAHASCF